ncbi:hypothetical protein FPQ18DRAFT_304746 [Pyronema domesticum]|nr:hypothetical protein FPQ18DRAFT_304746 [Pyronema domesticum]
MAFAARDGSRESVGGSFFAGFWLWPFSCSPAAWHDDDQWESRGADGLRTALTTSSMDSPYLRFLDRPAIRSDYNHAEGRQLSNSKSSNSAPQLPTHKCSSAPTGQKSCKPNVDAVVRRIGALAGSAPHSSVSKGKSDCFVKGRQSAGAFRLSLAGPLREPSNCYSACNEMQSSPCSSRRTSAKVDSRRRFEVKFKAEFQRPFVHTPIVVYPTIHRIKNTQQQCPRPGN